MNRKKHLENEKATTDRRKEDVSRLKEYVSTKQEKTKYEPKELQYPLDPSYPSFDKISLALAKNPIKKGRGPKGKFICLLI